MSSNPGTPHNCEHGRFSNLYGNTLLPQTLVCVDFCDPAAFFGAGLNDEYRRDRAIYIPGVSGTGIAKAGCRSRTTMTPGGPGLAYRWLILFDESPTAGRGGSPPSIRG